MDQVVVVGYGRQKLPTVTGSVSVVAGKDLAQTPVANVTNMLVGMAPGITGIQNSGEPGQNGTTYPHQGSGPLNESRQSTGGDRWRATTGRKSTSPCSMPSMRTTSIISAS